MKHGLVLFLLLALAAPALAQEAVHYRSGNETVKAVLYKPKDARGKLPAIVVIHEWWGLVPWVKQQAQQFADQGYVTLAIDLYRGKSTTDPEVAHELMRGVPQDRATRDLKAATAYLRGRADVDGARVGTIGWCMGGGYALALAENDPKLKAAFINYGAVSTESSTLQPIHAAIYGVWGGLDRGISADDVRAFAAKMKSLGKDIQIKIYADAGHGFENPNNQAGYVAADAADAFRRQTDFFARKLKQ